MTQNSDQGSCFDPAVWHQFCQDLQRSGQQILANTPDNGVDRTEGFRYLARWGASSVANSMMW